MPKRRKTVTKRSKSQKGVKVRRVVFKRPSKKRRKWFLGIKQRNPN